jgi:hypothetical protein
MFTSEKLLIGRKMEKESQFLRNRSLKGLTEKILKSLDLKKIEMEFTLANFSKENAMEKENLFGIMDNHFKESGEMGKKMGLDCGDPLEEIITKDNGEIIDKMEKDIMFILGVQSTKDSLKIFSSMDKEMKRLPMEIDTQVNINLVNLMAKEDMYGKMEITTKDNL